VTSAHRNPPTLRFLGRCGCDAKPKTDVLSEDVDERKVTHNCHGDSRDRSELRADRLR
jgi:hypothetical protein